MNQSELKGIFAQFIQYVQVGEYMTERFGLQGNYADKVVIDITVGGASGGSCWDDSPACPFTRREKEIQSELRDELRYKFSEVTDKLDIPTEKVLEVCTKLVNDGKYSEVGSFCQGEYYGNYTDYQAYAVDMKDFFKEVLYVTQYEVFEEALREFTQVAEIDFSYNSLTKRQTVLAEKLVKIDDQRKGEKTQLEREIKKLQAQARQFDGMTVKQKKTLQDELDQVTTELEKVTKIKFG